MKSENLKLYIQKNGRNTEVKKALFASTGCEYVIFGEQSPVKWCKKLGVTLGVSPKNNGDLWIEFETEEDLIQFTLSWL
jgi:hypothetical protein